MRSLVGERPPKVRRLNRHAPPNCEWPGIVFVGRLSARVAHPRHGAIQGIIAIDGAILVGILLRHNVAARIVARAPQTTVGIMLIRRKGTRREKVTVPIPTSQSSCQPLPLLRFVGVHADGTRRSCIVRCEKSVCDRTATTPAAPLVVSRGRPVKFVVGYWSKVDENVIESVMLASDLLSWCSSRDLLKEVTCIVIKDTEFSKRQPRAESSKLRARPLLWS